MAKDERFAARLYDGDRDKIEVIKQLTNNRSDADLMRALMAVAQTKTPEEIQDFFSTITRDLPTAKGVGRKTSEPIPVVGKIPAGQLSLIHSINHPVAYLQAENVKAAPDSFAMEVTGHSMTGNEWRGGGLRDGDYVILCRHFDHYDGEMAAIITADDTHTLKMLFKENGKVVCRPMNPEYPDQTLNFDELVAVYVVSDIVRKEKANLIEVQ